MTEDIMMPIRQQQIIFNDDQILAVQLEDGRIFVPIRHMCEILGVGYQGQIDRIRRDPVLSKYEMQLDVARDAGRGGRQAANCLLLKFVPGWLFGISASRVREEVREKLIRFQEEVHDVIADAFRPQPDAEISPISQHVDELEAIAQMGLAIYHLARQQRAIEDRVGTLESAMWDLGTRTQEELAAVREELGTLELRLKRPPAGKISEQQAAELSQAVKLVAISLGKRSGRNEFGAIYGELYRRFGITSYRNLPVHAFEEAMEWLTSWYRSLTEGGGGTTEAAEDAMAE